MAEEEFYRKTLRIGILDSISCEPFDREKDS